VAPSLCPAQLYDLTHEVDATSYEYQRLYEYIHSQGSLQFYPIRESMHVTQADCPFHLILIHISIWIPNHISAFLDNFLLALKRPNFACVEKSFHSFLITSLAVGLVYQYNTSNIRWKRLTSILLVYLPNHQSCLPIP